MYSLKCPRCRKVYEFEGLAPKMCPECYVREKQDYTLVREYVRSNKGAGIHEVAEQTGVSAPKILHFIREELLEVIPNGTSFLLCRKCSVPINTGIFCDNCKRTYGESALQTSYAATPEISDGVMHIAIKKNEEEGKKYKIKKNK